jgi:hypothetical protein
VSGHGHDVNAVTQTLRQLMHKNINAWDQSDFMRGLMTCLRHILRRTLSEPGTVANLGCESSRIFPSARGLQFAEDSGAHNGHGTITVDSGTAPNHSLSDINQCVFSADEIRRNRGFWYGQPRVNEVYGAELLRSENSKQ